jgi:Zn-dependent peptidase ImmA (M78 family)/transcriptional regulator with XRE-family HTH domain
MSLPSRLRVARHRRGWSFAELAERCGVSARSLGDYERGLARPEPSTLEDIARALDFPVDFFSAPELEDLPAASASFRAMSRLSARQRNAAIASAMLAIEFSQWLSRRYELPTVTLEDFSGMDAETCASVFRRQTGLGERPVRNVVHLLERHGVRVLSLAEDCQELDAISLWSAGTPLVMLNCQKSAERTRFDAAHELGHLLLHRHGHGECTDPDPDDPVEILGKDGRAVENEANQFASAFLMPRATLLATVPRAPRLAELIQIKREWKVSLASLVYRLHSLEAISDSHYRYLCMDMSRKGYRTQEPFPMPERETSQILAKAFDDLRSNDIGRMQVARMLRWPKREIDGMVFGLAMSVLPGAADATSPRRGHLQVVK